jgi:hypothetical protein
MVSRVGLGRCGGLRLEDAVHGRSALGEGGPDLVPVDGLGGRRAAVPNQVADVLKPIRGLLQWSEACLSLGTWARIALMSQSVLCTDLCTRRHGTGR